MTRFRNLMAVSTLAMFLAFGAVGCNSAGKNYDPAPAPGSGGQSRVGNEYPVNTPPAPSDYNSTRTPVQGTNPATGQAIVREVDTAMLKGRLTDEQKQQIVHDAMLNIKQVIVSTDEKLQLAGGAQATEAGRNVIERSLAEKGFRVTQTRTALSINPSVAEQDRFFNDTGASLAVVASANSKQYDKFGNFYSFVAEMNGKVLNLATHQIVATFKRDKRGQRAQSEQSAAESAVEMVAADVATYLTDEALRKWETTSLVKRQLTVTNIRKAEEVESLRGQLQGNAGIYYVSMESFDAASQQAQYEILARFDADRHLSEYVNRVNVGRRVRVERVDSASGVIRARID